MFTENGYQPQQNVPNDFVTYDAKKSKKNRKKSEPKTISEKLDLVIMPLMGAAALSLAYLVWQAVSGANEISAIAGLL